MDVEGIRDAEAFPAALRRAIEGSDAFVFVISPDSVRSEFCEQEVAHASELNKRIVPVALREVPDGEIPGEIRFRNWIPAGDEASVERLLAALETDLEWERQHTRLTVKALEWEAAGRDRSFLLRGADLAGAEGWLAAGAGRDPGPTELEQAYLLAGRNGAQRRQRGVVGVSLVVAAISLGLLIFALISRGNAISARNTAQTEARVALARELGAEAVNQPRIDVAMLLAREAVNLDRSPQTESTLLATLLRGPAVIGTIPLPANSTAALGFSPDGHTLAAADGQGELRLFNARTHALSTAPVGGVSPDQPPVYSGDGTLLAFGFPGSGSIVVCDARSLQTVADLSLPLTAPPSPSVIRGGSIAIARDHHHARTVYYAYWIPGGGGEARTAYLQRWSLPSGATRRTIAIGSGPLLALRLIGDGSRLMIVSARSVTALDTRSMRSVSTINITPAPIAPTAAAISPDGRSVVIGSKAGSVSFIDTSTGQVRTPAEGQRAAITSLAYPSNGRTVVSVGSDDSVITWDPRTAAPNEVLTGPSGHVAGAAVSPDGSTLYTSLVGGVLVEWDLNGARRFGDRFTVGSAPPCCDAVTPQAPPLVLSPNGSRFAVRLGSSAVGVFSSKTLRLATSFAIGNTRNVITALAWSPVGDRLAVAGHSGLVELWSTRGQPRRVSTLTGLRSRYGQPEAIQAVAFSSDGKLLAASDDDKIGSSGRTVSNSDYASLAIWRTATGRLVASPTGLNSFGSHGVEPFAGDDLLAFSPSGKLLAMSLFDQSIVLFDASTGDVVQVLASGAPTTSLAFAPDGTLANGTAAGTVELWNPATGNQIGLPLVAGGTSVTTIAFDPSGQRFATAGIGDGTVKLWFTTRLQQQGPVLSTDDGTTASAVFERDGNHLLAVDDAGNGFIWPTSVGAWEHQACSLAGRNLSRLEWSQQIIGHTYAPVCP
jgi:WD40 repeat protein